MKNILCFGDSNTWGYNAADSSRFAWNVRWTGLLQEKLNQKFPENFRIIEEGLVGRTTVFEDALRFGRKGSDFLLVALESSTPDFVILMLGTNDCKILYHATAEIIAKGIESLVCQIQKFAPNSKILLVSPILLGKDVARFDPEFDLESEKVSVSLKNSYKNVAEKYKISFLAASDFASPCEIDKEHLDEVGHKNLSEAIFAELEKLF